MSSTPAENPYAVPTSNLQEVVGTERIPSIEEALSRGYDFSLGQVLGESWQRVKGSKGLFIGGAVLYYAAILLVNGLFAALLAILGLQVGEDDIAGQIASQFAIGVLGSALTYPLFAGLMLLGIRRAADQPLSFNEVFSALRNPLPAIITGLIMLVLVYAATLLLILPGIYLGVAYILALPLVIERGLSPWQALETSRKAISQHWFKVFGLFMLLGLILVLSAIPLGIGLVWTLPLWLISMGVLYRIIFGVLPSAE